MPNTDDLDALGSSISLSLSLYLHTIICAYENSYPHLYHFQLLTELNLLNYDYYLFDFNSIKTQNSCDWCRVPGCSSSDFHFKLKPTKCASRDNKSHLNWHVELNVKWCQGSVIHIHIHGADWYFKFAIYPSDSDSYVYNETKKIIWNAHQLSNNFRSWAHNSNHMFSKIHQNISMQKKTKFQRRR